MKDHPKKGKTRVKLSRRDFLKAGAAGLGVAAMGGLLPDMLLAAKAPAFKKGTKTLNSAGLLFHCALAGSVQEAGPGVGRGERR